MFHHNKPWLLGTTSPICYAPDGEGTTAVSPPSAPGEGNAPPVEGNDKSIEKKVENFLDANQGLWQPEERKEPTPEEIAAQNQLTEDANKTFDQHIASVNFVGEDVDEKLAKAFEANDFKAVRGTLNDLMKNVYKRATLDTIKMVEKAKGDLTTEIDRRAKATVQISESEKSLQAALPKIMSNPATSPMAIAVKTQMLKKPGMTDAKANDMVKEFFKATFELGAEDIGLEVAPPPAPGERNGTGRGVRKSAPIDWVKVIKGG